MQAAASGAKGTRRGGGSTRTHAPPAGRVELQWLAAKRDRSRSRRVGGGRGERSIGARRRERASKLLQKGSARSKSGGASVVVDGCWWLMVVVRAGVRECCDGVYRRSQRRGRNDLALTDLMKNYTNARYWHHGKYRRDRAARHAVRSEPPPGPWSTAICAGDAAQKARSISNSVDCCVPITWSCGLVRRPSAEHCDRANSRLGSWRCMLRVRRCNLLLVSMLQHPVCNASAVAVHISASPQHATPWATGESVARRMPPAAQMTLRPRCCACLPP